MAGWDERQPEFLCFINKSWDTGPDSQLVFSSVLLCGSCQKCPIIFLTWGHGHLTIFLSSRGGLRCCPFPAACERCSPLPQQAQKHCDHLFLCKVVQFSKNYVGQQFKLIGLPSHWHWHRNTDMIYCRAELGGRKDGESSLVWWITGAWSRMRGSIRYYSKGRYSSHLENSLCCHAETSLLVQNNPNRSLCLPKC